VAKRRGYHFESQPENTSSGNLKHPQNTAPWSFGQNLEVT